MKINAFCLFLVCDSGPSLLLCGLDYVSYAISLSYCTAWRQRSSWSDDQILLFAILYTFNWCYETTSHIWCHFCCCLLIMMIFDSLPLVSVGWYLNTYVVEWEWWMMRWLTYYSKQETKMANGSLKIRLKLFA